MSLNVGALHAEMALDTTKFMKGVQSAVSGIQKIGQELQQALSTEAAQGFTTINRRLGNLMKQMAKVGEATVQLQTQFVQMNKNTQDGFAGVAKTAEHTAKAIGQITSAAKGATSAATKAQQNIARYTGARTAKGTTGAVPAATAVAQGNVTQATNQTTKATHKATTAQKAHHKATQQTAQAQQTVTNNVNNTNKGLKNSVKQVNQLKHSAHMMGKDVQRIIGGILVSQLFYRSVNAIQSGISAIAKYKANVETAMISFETLLGSQQKAYSFMESLKDFAALTPYTTEEAVNMSKVLMAMGFEAKNTLGVMTILTDAVSAIGGGAELLERITWSLGQIRSTGKLGGQEIRELGKAGIPILDILQKKLGLTNEQLKNIGDLSIDGQTAVTAILQGLQERYEGMGAKISNTMKGAWSTIKDDALMTFEAIFDAPYQKLLNFSRKIRDVAEQARHAIRGETLVATKVLDPVTNKPTGEVKNEWKKTGGGGVGNLFQTFVPPEWRNTAKAAGLVLNILGKAFKNLAGAVKDVAAPLGELAFRILVPVSLSIAKLAYTLSEVARKILQVSPLVRLLAQSFIVLLVAGSVSRTITMLWAAIGKGGIVAVVAEAVNGLTRALNSLYIVSTKNPITALITIMASAMIYFALSNKTAAAWIDQVTGRLANLLGLNLDSLLTPMDDWNKALEDYNNELDGINDNLTGTGKAADSAKKKVNGFVAAFDEVFQIPQKLDEVTDGLEESIPNLDLGGFGAGSLDLKLPEMPQIKSIGEDIGKIVGWGAAIVPTLILLRKWLEKDKNGPGGSGGGGGSAGYDWSKMPEWLRQLFGKSGPLGAPAAQDGKVRDPEGDFVGPPRPPVETPAPAPIPVPPLAPAPAGWRDMFTDEEQKELEEKLGWTTSLVNKLKEAFQNTFTIPAKSGLLEWFKNATDGATTWGKATESSTKTAGKGFADNVGAKVAAAKSSISTFFTDIANGLVKWGTNFANNTGKAFSSAYTNIKNNLTTASTGIGTFFNKVGERATEWGNGISDFFAGVGAAWERLGQKAGAAADTASRSTAGRIAAVGLVGAGLTLVFPPAAGIALPMMDKISNFIQSGAPIFAHAKGGMIGAPDRGFITKHQLYEAGEYNRREVVIPLADPEHMRPFAEAVASIMATSANGGTNRDILYVDTLVADDRGLTELYRRFEVIKLKEGRRKG